MAVHLEFLTVVVPREHFPRCRSLPEPLPRLNPAGGIFSVNHWYDEHLWCEVATDTSDAQDIVRKWERCGLKGLASGPGASRWEELCVAASEKGPTAKCDWLEYDSGENCVWRKGTEKDDVIGGRWQADWNAELLQTFLARAERCYAKMYDVASPKINYEDACELLSRALSLTIFLHLADEAERIAGRIEHVQAVYNSQFRGF